MLVAEGRRSHKCNEESCTYRMLLSVLAHVDSVRVSVRREYQSQGQERR